MTKELQERIIELENEVVRLNIALKECHKETRELKWKIMEYEEGK